MTENPLKKTMVCRICSNSEGNIERRARENVYGLDEEYSYVECGRCGCMQIAEIPTDMGKYYPLDYPCFALEEMSHSYKAYFRRARNRYAVYGTGILGKFLYARYPQEALFSMRLLNLQPSWRILDVGCGIGALLYFLREMGFHNSLGIDPFVAADVIHDNGQLIQKKYFAEVDGTWDLIIFQHSLEHMDNQAAILDKINRMLAPGGICQIRIPMMGSVAWAQYGVNWVQLDAPRHFYIHTEKSMALLIEQAGLYIEDVVYDSSGYQFWGSEQLLRNISVCSPESYRVSKKFTIFSKREMLRFEECAQQANRERCGDQAIFIIRKR